MLSGSMVAEIGARGNRDPGLLQQLLTQTLAIVGQATGVGVEIEGTPRQRVYAESEFAQCRVQEIPTCLELPPTMSSWPRLPKMMSSPPMPSI